MYAVVTTGGKQYRVEEGETLRVEKIAGDVGSSVTFDRVLMISDGETASIGQPVLDDASVEGHIVEQGKSKKIIVFKYKRRKRYRRKHGHRQQFTAVKIDSIKAKGIALRKKTEPETEAGKPEAKKKEARESIAGVETHKPQAPPKAEVKKEAAKKPEAKAAAKVKETKKAVKPKAKKAETKTKTKKADTKKASAKKITAKKPTAKSKKKAD
jgi:large subunit ribosomal protein L21